MAGTVYREKVGQSICEEICNLHELRSGFIKAQGKGNMEAALNALFEALDEAFAIGIVCENDEIMHYMDAYNRLKKTISGSKLQDSLAGRKNYPISKLLPLSLKPSFSLLVNQAAHNIIRCELGYMGNTNIEARQLKLTVRQPGHSMNGNQLRAVCAGKPVGSLKSYTEEVAELQGGADVDILGSSWSLAIGEVRKYDVMCDAALLGDKRVGEITVAVEMAEEPGGIDGYDALVTVDIQLDSERLAGQFMRPKVIHREIFEAFVNANAGNRLNIKFEAVPWKAGD